MLLGFFKLVCFQIFSHFEFGACKTFHKKVAQGQQMIGKVNEWSKSTCLESCTGEQVNRKQLNVMIGYKRSIPKRYSCSKARSGDVQHFVNSCLSKESKRL